MRALKPPSTRTVLKDSPASQILLKRNAPASKKVFLNKIYIALKECAETSYWLDLLFETKYQRDNEYSSLKNDCENIRRILLDDDKNNSAKK